MKRVNSVRILRRILQVAVVGAIFFGSTLASAQSQSTAIGLKGGINWSKLLQPVDSRGELTLMHGTAFSGFGYSFGGAFELRYPTASQFSFGAELDAFYSRHVADGFERNHSTGAERSATLATDVVRVPLLGKMVYSIPGAETELSLGAGPGLWWGFQSEATVTQKNTRAPAIPLNTTPVTHATLDAVAGLGLVVSEALTIPFEVRGTWDPFVRKSTVDRFRDFESADRPGSYEVAFHWQVLLTTGFSWELP